MRAPLLSGFALLIAAHAMTAVADVEYSTTVRQPYARPANVRRVALMPAACPATVECGELAVRFAELLGQAGGFEVVHTMDVRDVMDSAQMTSLDHETRMILSESLKVDAFASIAIREAAVEKGATVYVKMGIAKVPQEGPSIKRVELVLRMIGKDGAVLLESSGRAHLAGTMRSLTAIAEHTGARTIEDSFPARR